MCCQDTNTLSLPAPVIETLAQYRRLLDERGWDWGDEQIDLFRWTRFTKFGAVFAEYAATGDWAQAIRSVIDADVPVGVVVVRVDESGALRADVGPALIAVAGRTVAIDVIVDSTCHTALTLSIAGRQAHVPARGAAVETIDLDGAHPAFTVSSNGDVLTVDGAARTCASAELTLASSHCARWSVTDASGGAWFPDGVLTKWDFHHRPFFHGHDVTLTVPAEALEVVCTRGLEFDREVREVTPPAGERVTVEC